MPSSCSDRLETGVGGWGWGGDSSTGMLAYSPVWRLR